MLRRPAARLLVPAAAIVAIAVVAVLLVLLLRGDGGRRLALGVPAYGHPSVTTLWRDLRALPRGSVVVLNPANGPGDAREPAYADAIEPLRGHGITLLGYVDTGYGARTADAIRTDVRRFRRLYPVDGVFLDQTVARGPDLAALVALVGELRAQGLAVAVNPGQPDLDPSYGDLDAAVVDFEGTLDAYRDARFPSPASAAGGARSWHLVHGVAAEGDMQTAVSLARQRGAELVFVTDGTMPNPWTGLPPYVAAELDAARG